MLETRCGMQILPDSRDVADINQRLNDKRLYRYLTKNVKYNKNRRSQITAERKALKRVIRNEKYASGSH